MCSVCKGDFRQRNGEEMSYKVRYQRFIEFVPNDIEVTAKNFVAAYYNLNHPTSSITHDDVVIVWKCYILGNWKILATTNVQDGMYYELTYSDDNEHGEGHLYFDAYKRWENIDYRINYDSQRNIYSGSPCNPC